MREFRSGSSRILISTDLLARGIDVQQAVYSTRGDFKQLDLPTVWFELFRCLPTELNLPDNLTDPDDVALMVTVTMLAMALRDKSRGRGNDSSAPSWTSNMGPSRGVKFRGGAAPTPPAWSYDVKDIRAYEKYEKKVRLWQMHARHFMTDKEIGLSLYTSPRGEAEQELEFLEAEAIYDRQGVDAILQHLRASFQQKTSVYIKRQYLFEYETLGCFNCAVVPEPNDDPEGDDLPQEGQDEVPGDDDELGEKDPSGEDLGLNDLAEVLTVTARKLAAVTQGRKFSGQPKRSLADKKRNSICAGCGNKGHWANDDECPLNQNQSGSSSAAPKRKGKGHKGRDDRGAVDAKKVMTVFHNTGFDSTIEYIPDDTAPNHHFAMVCTAPIFSCLTTSFQDSFGYMIMDTACQRACCGQMWMDGHEKLLKEFSLKVFYEESNEHFQFGSGQPVVSTQKAWIPAGLEQHCLSFGVNVLPSEIPFLGSLKILNSLGSIIDLNQRVVHFSTIGVTCPLKRVCGHLAVEICVFPPRPHRLSIWSKLFESGFTDPEIAHVCLLKVYDPVLRQRWKHLCRRLHHLARAAVVHVYQAKRLGVLSAKDYKNITDKDETTDDPKNKEKMPQRRAKASTAARSKTASSAAASSSTPAKAYHVKNQTECPHPTFKRRGNRHGSFATCTARMARWKWDGRGWKQHGSSSKLSLPLPSFLTTVDGSIKPPGYTGETFLQLPPPGYETHEAIQPDAGLRCGIHRSGGTRGGGDGQHLQLAPGKRKRLVGEVKKATKALWPEVLVVNDIPSEKNKPHYVDVFELFAGSAKATLFAKKYGLNALEPYELADGKDLCDKKVESFVLDALRRMRPLLLLIGFPCTEFCIMNENCNYALRPEELELRRALMRPALKWVCKLCQEQAASGRYYILENPLRSRLWQEACVKELYKVDNTEFVNCDGGAFGAVDLDGFPIIKTYGFLLNCPKIARALDRRLSPQERQVCKPLEGANVTASQVYPDDLVHAILRALRKTANTFTGGTVRSLVLQPGQALFKRVESLVPWELTRVQIASTPMTRRMPRDIPFTHRGAALLHADESLVLEAEDLAVIEFPKQRFSKVVSAAIFFYGLVDEDLPARQEQPSGEPDPGDQGDPQLPVPGLRTDVTFPGAPKELASAVKASVARLRLNTGHANKKELIRFLSAHGSVNFGERVQLDIVYVRDLTGSNHMILGMVDLATSFQQAVRVQSRNAEHVLEMFRRAWLAPYGYPLVCEVDADGAFEGEFRLQLEHAGVHVPVIPPEAHWRIGTVERRNAILRTALEKLIDENAVVNGAGLDWILVAAVQALNASTASKGRCPYQAVFGRLPRFPGDLFSDDRALAVTDSHLLAEELRCQALRVINEMRASQTIRRALPRKTKPGRDECKQILPGSLAAYWRWSKKVTYEQLRPAYGMESWTPSLEDMKALKTAELALTDGLWRDERGPGPPEEETLDVHVDEPMAQKQHQWHLKDNLQLKMKALDREIPWRVIVAGPKEIFDLYVAANIKEYESWLSWACIRPLSEERIHEIKNTPSLKRRIIPARNAYRDKNRQAQCTDCKSLYDAVISPNVSTSEKRTMIAIRSAQDFIKEDECRKGVAINFVTNNDVRIMKDLERHVRAKVRSTKLAPCFYIVL
ncbi:unnamed protein product [Durusdinium trenchii]|uniref:Integrase catalytic domain-containing protein n=1 Tax=Durusdinium trenchii TaxID=1381693 RepID=A0ABP0KQ35_9DINO